jgi:hypothetical protein
LKFQQEKEVIKVRYSSIDGFSKTAKFKTMNGARKFAHKWVGEHPEIGSHYAVAGDGVGKVTVEGTTLAELFPNTLGAPDEEWDWLNDFNYVGSKHHY